MPEPLIPSVTPPAQPAQENLSGAPAAPDAGGSPPPSNEVVRPEGLPDQFWDAEKNAPKYEDLIKSHGELSTFKSEADAKLASVPAKPDEYKVPEQIADEEVAKLIPKGKEITIDPKDPMLAAFREFAHAQKMTNEQFGEAVKLYIKQQIIEEKAFADAREAEIKKLGNNGPQRQKAVNDFLLAHAGQKDAETLLSSVFSAEQFEAMERLIARFSKQDNVLPLHAKRDDPTPPPVKSVEQRWYGTPQKAS
jgi:hypothetical protein